MGNYSDEFIGGQKEALLKEKTRLEQGLKEVAVFDESQGRYVPKYENLNEGDVEDISDSPEEDINYDENAAMADNTIKLLDDVNNALQAIDSGEYGKCQNCSSYISEERLRAYPAAKTCIKCG